MSCNILGGMNFSQKLLLGLAVGDFRSDIDMLVCGSAPYPIGDVYMSRGDWPTS